MEKGKPGSLRLNTIASYVNDGSRICDVGCDHALLPVYLVSSGKAYHAIAMDVNRGPLKRAKENVVRAGFEDKIEIRLSDGLDALNTGEADHIIMAGMGGALMIRILDAGFDKALSAARWILQPQSEIPEVRAWLRSRGIGILDESMLVERSKYYNVILADSTPAACSFDNKGDYRLYDRFGQALLERKDPVLIEYLVHEYRRITRITGALPPNCDNRLSELYEELELVRQALLITGQQI